MSSCSRGRQWSGNSELCWTSVGEGSGGGEERKKDRGMEGEERVTARGRNVNEEWRSGLKMGERMTGKSDTERKDSLLYSFP